MQTTKSKAASAVRVGAGLAVEKRGELAGLLRSCSARIQVWLQPGKYVSALMSGLPEANGWAIARQCGDRTPDKTQRLLDHASCRHLTKARLIRGAGLRWPAEEDFEVSKDCFGLDQCQARLYTAIARHLILVMAALAVCAVTAVLLRARTGTQAPPPGSPGQPPPADPGPVPLSVPEIKCITAALTIRGRVTLIAKWG